MQVQTCSSGSLWKEPVANCSDTLVFQSSVIFYWPRARKWTNLHLIIFDHIVLNTKLFWYVCQLSFYSVIRWDCAIDQFRSSSGSVSSRKERDQCAATSRTLGHPVLSSRAMVCPFPRSFQSGCGSRSLRQTKLPADSYPARLLSDRFQRSDGEVTTLEIEKKSRECKSKKVL